MTGKNRNFFRNFKNAKNESDLCLEIAKFSDPTSYLPNIYKYKISDRLTYNMYRFESKKMILPRVLKIEPFSKICHYKTNHQPKHGNNYFYPQGPIFSEFGPKTTIHIRSNGTQLSPLTFDI